MGEEGAEVAIDPALSLESTLGPDLGLGFEEELAAPGPQGDRAAAGNQSEHPSHPPQANLSEANLSEANLSDPEASAALPPPLPSPAILPTPSFASVAATQIQVHTARLLHVQTDTPLELPHNLSIIRIGKPNDRIPPDVDVSGFPHAEVVSRVHAQLRVEGDVYYVEDSGSANGTYVNGLPLPVGNRHRLRSGDRIALGKNDLVSFLFNLT